ncbi:hypothetical protein LCGC14_0917390 [marine sediment metagenome]|uniref:HNH nuclease domain-containing protein n=1 Tax=marine sediment metagenome TaxID=412755 RepID=A0A0F9RYJ0_9ZZZZ
MAQYVIQRKSLRTIREETGLGINTIKRWLRKHGIETRQDDEVVRSQKGHKLSANPKWKGKYNNTGYNYIYNPEHPNASPSGYISESRFVAEELVGRVLSIDEFVHHIDMDKTNNLKDNLYISQQRAHKNIHASFNRLCKELMIRGIVTFNKESESYGC